MADELKDQRIPIMMSPSEVKAIDDWMFASRIKSRSEAIRRLCQVGLAASEDLDKVTENSRRITEIISHFIRDNELNNFRDLDVHRQVSVATKILQVILKNISEPVKMIFNINDIVQAYKTWELPEGTKFPEGKTIIEVLEHFRLKYADETKENVQTSNQTDDERPTDR